MGIFFFITVMLSSLNASSVLVNLKDGDKAVIIDKDKGLLKIVQKNNSEYKTLQEFFVSYGQKDGLKAVEGDNKTPEGVYFATGIKTKHDLKDLPEEIYGSYAIPLNYPNPIDKQKGNTGYGIWLHGTDNEEKLSGKNITKGCIIMENTNINQLVKQLRVMQTPIVISSNPENIKLEKSLTLTSITFKSGSENYKVTIQPADGLEKTPKVLYEEIK